mmetsp:Transcript_40373/g.89655  ORF Transcript_40373/g.89655 Transcript_40373/m.89655 type:complete len:119 (+) Transcript_40373:47-403(+)|eukprot:CAMPEP_0202901998 /NCGR_PEP_ID=MMETSP1392-20130828/15834_1 /ASSEMBLY_ACC=CAM_ASM_000868 /TAXON_ID=225041 /ORGANISM="Chlamydomonas chlamydogama, Strain SAG 11-48b" /LENGTH=118 /DNA_ID=CAMNT_0049588673 /DNA_START=36 /DNA_END=392 /DNA_ORIENTATION=-
MSLARVLAADTAGGSFQKAHEYAGIALAGATPISLLSKNGGVIQKMSDLVLAFAIPVHMHISTNACVTDYLPKAARGPARAAVLGCSLVTYLGLMKLNLAGPGITRTVTGLWSRPAKK